MTLDRDRLIEEHVPFAIWLVTQKVKTLPLGLDTDALYGAALEALVRCARRYDPMTGLPFLKFAQVRLRGAVLDELRVIGGGPRSGRRPLSGAGPLHLSPIPEDLDDIWRETACDEPGYETIEDLMMTTEVVERWLTYLAPTDRLMACLYHFEGMLLREIADIYGVTEARISQRMTQARRRLRNLIQPAAA